MPAWLAPFLTGPDDAGIERDFNSQTSEAGTTDHFPAEIRVAEQAARVDVRHVAEDLVEKT